MQEQLLYKKKNLTQFLHVSQPLTLSCEWIEVGEKNNEREAENDEGFSPGLWHFTAAITFLRTTLRLGLKRSSLLHFIRRTLIYFERLKSFMRWHDQRNK